MTAYVNVDREPRNLDLVRPADSAWRLQWDPDGVRPHWLYVEGGFPEWMLVSWKPASARRWFWANEMEIDCGLELVHATPDSLANELAGTAVSER